MIVFGVMSGIYVVMCRVYFKMVLDFIVNYKRKVFLFIGGICFMVVLCVIYWILFL